jgi:DNA-binding NarL/FixJ family response regulator
VQSNTNQNPAVKIRVLLADDNEEMLRDVEELLASDFDIVGKATDGLSAVEAASRLTPDLIVTDLAMPGLSGIEASRKVLTARPDTSIVLLTLHNDARLVEQAFSVGIRGYVHKLTAAEELIPALRCVLRGQTFVSPACRPSRPN